MRKSRTYKLSKVGLGLSATMIVLFLVTMRWSMRYDGTKFAIAVASEVGRAIARH